MNTTKLNIYEYISGTNYLAMLDVILKHSVNQASLHSFFLITQID